MKLELSERTCNVTGTPNALKLTFNNGASVHVSKEIIEGIQGLSIPKPKPLSYVVMDRDNPANIYEVYEDGSSDPYAGLTWSQWLSYHRSGRAILIGRGKAGLELAKKESHNAIVLDKIQVLQDSLK